MRPQRKPLRTLLLYGESRATETLSYYRGWPQHILAHPAFTCEPINLLRRADLAKLLVPRRRFDVAVALHSTFSNEPYLRGALCDFVRAAARTRVLFVGNEYKLMPAKIALAERLRVDLLVTQLDAPEAQELYRRRLGCEVAYIPYTGLDERLFAPGGPSRRRPVDIGYRAFETPWYLGHREREALVSVFSAAAGRRGLRADVSLDPARRFAGSEWAEFLRRCRAQLGSEAGGDAFELTDETRESVNELLALAPDTSFDEVYARFFAGRRDAVSGRALSGRVVEAAGTKTVQILVTGRHGGFFEPDVHYIPVRRDLSDADDALDRLEDDAACAAMVDAAYEISRTRLTYDRLIDDLVSALERVLV